MANIVLGTGRDLNVHTLDSLHEFREKVFVGRLGWSLPMLDDTERDQYDTPDTLHLIVTNDAGHITACARLLSTTGSYMLPELFPQFLAGQPAPRDPAIWELSRFAANMRHGEGRRNLSLSQPTLELLNQVIRLARSCNVERLLLITSVGIERLMLRTGIMAHRLGIPLLIGGALCVALFIEVRAEICSHLALESVPDAA